MEEDVDMFTYDKTILENCKTKGNSSWLDNFENTYYWLVRGEGVNVTASEGMLTLTFHWSKKPNHVFRKITPAENFKLKFRLRFIHHGEVTGMYLAYNGVRFCMFISESKIKLQSTGRDVESYLIAVDIGNKWHDYEIDVCDRVARVYMDSSFLMSVETETYNAENELAFFGRGENIAEPCVMELEYVSYAVMDNKDIIIVSPAIKEVVGIGIATVEVEVKLSQGMEAPLEYFLDGKYMGSSNNTKFVFENLVPGVYRTYVKCGSYKSAERIFVVKREERPENNLSHLILHTERFDGDPGKLPKEYMVEFKYTHGKKANVILSDGEFLLALDIAEDGVVHAMNAPYTKVEYKKVIELEADSSVRVRVCFGIVTIYVNGLWRTSLRLPPSIAERNLYIYGVKDFQIQKDDDCYFYSCTDFEPDKDGQQFFHTFAHNTLISAELLLATEMSGIFLLVARYDKRKGGIVAGYDFNKNCVVIGNSIDMLNELVTVKMDDTMVKMVLTLEVKDSRIKLYMNGIEVSSTVTEFNGSGNIGYIDKSYNTVFQSFDYQGDSKVMTGITSSFMPGNHTVTMLELGDSIYICGETATLLKSMDGGYSFNHASRGEILKEAHFNTIVLNTGEVVSVNRTEKNGLGYIYEAYISNDRGYSFTGPYPIHQNAAYHRHTMNGKLMQTSSGRLIFASGESESEHSGNMAVYYSDDKGKKWIRSKTVLNQNTTGGLNLQEGCVIEVKRGILRMYMRNDGGFLVYTESYDNGETWNHDVCVTEFASVLCAFNVTHDKYTDAFYLAWEYNNANDCIAVQFPRTRIALAVSYDKCETWKYVGDIDAANKVVPSTNLHMNIGVFATADAVFVTAAKREQLDADIGMEWHNYVVRIDKASILPSEKFAVVRSYTDNICQNRIKTNINDMMRGIIIIARDGRVWAQGKIYASFAEYVGGDLTVDEFARTQGLTKNIIKMGTIVLSKERALMNYEFLLAQAGIY